MTHQADEETPLLNVPQVQPKPKRTPLPWAQFSIVLFLQLAEPLTSQVIYPFTPQLIRDLGIADSEHKVGYYVGLLQSLFFLTQAMTVLHWSRISDLVGRKPVILTGLFGLSMSMYCFGLSRTFWGLVLSRCLNGALNGNIGVIKSIMAEMTDATNISQAYAYQPIAWSTGGTLGPMLGGALARPAERFPRLFGDSEFFKTYPYFLPCAVPATFSIVAWIVTFLYLKETVKSPVPIRKLLRRRNSEDTLNDAALDDPAKAIPEDEKPHSLRNLLIPQVIIAGLNYACLALIDVAFRALQPLFLSTPIALGGLGLAPPEIGKILSLFGILNGLSQVFFFATIHDYLGSRKTFIIGIASALPLFALFPVVSMYAQVEGLSFLVWGLVLIQVIISIALSFSYGAIFIYIAAASPNRASLGGTNGLCQMSVSVFRAIGPAATNSLFSISISQKILGGYLVYYVLLVVVGISLFVASLLPSQVWRK